MFTATFQFERFDEKYCGIVIVFFLSIYIFRQIDAFLSKTFQFVSFDEKYHEIIHLLIAMKRNGLTEKFVKDSNFCFFRQIIGLARQSVLTSYLQHFVEHTNGQQI